MNTFIFQPPQFLHGKPVNLLSFCIAVAIANSIATQSSYAEQVFNPAFLTDGLANSQISDLSKFEQTQAQLPGVYRVDIMVNDEYKITRDVHFVEKAGVDDATGLFPCLNLSTLESFGVNVQDYPELSQAVDPQCLEFTHIVEGSLAQFAFDKQKLLLSFPQAALKNQIRGYIPPEQWDAGIAAAFTNYNLSGYENSLDNSRSVFVGLNSGFNLGTWQVRNASSFNYNSTEQNSVTDWQNLNTYVQTSMVPLKSTLVLGENSTSNDIFDSFSFRGAHLFSADAMYPDSQQGYAPTVRGIAKSTAKVVIQQNGYTIHQVTVPPGPFVIEDLNPTSVSGDLHVNIEENDGTSQSYTVPYSTLPILQREGRTRYSIFAGQFRSGVATQDKPTVVQATAIHGFKKGISIYSGTQLADEYQSALLGLGSNLGEYGAVSFDLTHANSELADGSDHQGQSLRFLYAKSLMRSGTTFRLMGYRYSTQGFYTLNDVAYRKMSDYSYDEGWDGAGAKVPIISQYYNLNHAKKGRVEFNISHSLDKDYGSLFVSGNQQTYWGTTDENRWIQAGYANSWHGLTFSLSATHTKSAQIHQSDSMIVANISFPLEKLFPKARSSQHPLRNSYITASSTQNSKGNDSYLTSLSGTLLDRRNLNYNISQGYINDQGQSGSLSLGYQGAYGSVGASYSYDRDHHQFTYNATGAALAHADGVTFGQSLSDTSILVKVPGAKNVAIENYTGVSTDWRGYAIVPYATAYRQNRVALDSNSFANNLEVSQNVETVVPMQGAIVRAKFNANIGIRALITLSKNGEFIPYASQVLEKESGAQGFAAEDGRVYLTGLPLKGNLQVIWGAGQKNQCLVPYDISGSDLSKPVTQFHLECPQSE